MKKIILILSILVTCLTLGCNGEDVITNITTEVRVQEVRTATVQEIKEAKVSFPIESFDSFESAENPVYIAAVDAAWFIKLKIVKILSEGDSPVKAGKTYAAVIHSPVMILGFGLNDAVGKTTTVDFLFLKNSDGSSSLALEVPDGG